MSGRGAGVDAVLFSTLAGFAFARLRFRGRDALFLFVVATLAVPTQLGIIPLYIAMSDLGWTGTLWAVIVPNLVSAIGVFWMRQYTAQVVPYELIEASRVDGCGVLRVYRHVCLPAVRPAAAFLAGLGKFRALTKAARDSLADPKGSEVLVNLLEPYQITSTQRPDVALVVDDSEIARITFEISFVFGMFSTAVVIRRGAIESVDCEACSLEVTLSLEGWQPPLLKRDPRLRVRLPVRPPIPIPCQTRDSVRRLRWRRPAAGPRPRRR